jgi:seryl-tRNA synthetase
MPTEKEEMERNLKKYGLNFTDATVMGILMQTACEMGRLLEEYNLLNGLTDDTFNWYNNHKQRDASIKREEQLKKLEEIKNEIESLDTKRKELNQEAYKLSHNLGYYAKNEILYGVSYDHPN